MTNTTTPAESIGGSSTAASFYRWEVPDKPIAVHLSLDLIDRLERETLAAFKAVTKRGSEIGGVLVGRVIPGDKRAITIEEFEPVECGYSRGPLYLLADEDKARLQEALERIRNSGNGRVVTGFFRSNTRRELALDEDDLALANEYFSDPSHVLLLVRPFAMKPSAGGFFIWENGQIRGEESYLQFPFKRAELLKTMAQYIVGAPDGAAAELAAKSPLVMPKREERPVVPPPALKREEPAIPPSPPAGFKSAEPASPVIAPPPRPEEPKPVVVAPPPPKKQDPPPVSFKREERPVAAPPKRDDRPMPQFTLRREDRSPIVPVIPKREERPAGPTLVSKREEPAPAPASPKKEEKPPAPPITVKRDERPAIVVRREDRPAVKREEPAPVRPVEKPVVAKAPEVVPETPAPEPKKEEPAAVKSEPAPIAEAPAFISAAETPTPGVFSRFKWVFIAVALVIALAAGYFVVRSLNRPAEQAAKTSESPLGLKVELNAGQLLLRWDREAPLIATATRATLSITDGDHREDVDLDLGTLRSGSIVYSPMTNDVSFRLEVTDLKNGKSLSESVRRLAGRPSPTVAAVQPPTAQPAPSTTDKPAAAPAQTTTTQQSAAAPAPAQQQTQPPAPEQPKVLAGPAVTAAPPKQDSLAARLRAPEPQEMPAPPTLQAQAELTHPVVTPSASLPAPAPPVAQPAGPAARPGTPAPAQQAQSQAQPAAQPRSGGRAVEAKLLSRVPPIYPALARSSRISGIVRVVATIGADGKVKKATATSGPPLLRQAAVEAVKRWRYTPATLNGEPVESETQVDVNFMM